MHQRARGRSTCGRKGRKSENAKWNLFIGISRIKDGKERRRKSCNRGERIREFQKKGGDQYKENRIGIEMRGKAGGKNVEKRLHPRFSGGGAFTFLWRLSLWESLRDLPRCCLIAARKNSKSSWKLKKSVKDMGFREYVPSLL